MQNLDTYGDRLAAAIKYRKTTQTKLAEAIGRTPQAVSQVIRGDTKSLTGINHARAVAFLRIRSEWLADHKGPMVDEGSNVVESERADRVPLISWVAAGAWCNIEDPYAVGDAEDWLICPVRHGPRTYALRVVGPSMYDPTGERSFKDGDYIFVDPDRDYHHKSLVIVRLDDDNKATFKRLLIDGDQRMLEALNPSWPNRIMEINGRATMCGVVISKMESFI